MARIRTVKPELFVHEGLSELSPLHRLVFIGLFCLADREGRLRDRPRSIKLATAPWDECNIEQILSDLANSRDRFIERYTSPDGEKLIQIRNFSKHQVINARETPSDLPSPDSDASGTRDPRVGTGEVHARGEGKEGREGKGKDACESVTSSSSSSTDAPPSPKPRPPVTETAAAIRGHPWLGQVLDPGQVAMQLVDAFPSLDVPHHVRLAAAGLGSDEVEKRRAKAGPQKYLVRYLEVADEARVKRAADGKTAEYTTLRDLGAAKIGGGAR